jgi:hypothetical protein
VVLAGEVTVEEGAFVQGDLVVIGGGLRLDGEARGSAVVIGGSASLGAPLGRPHLAALVGRFHEPTDRNRRRHHHQSHGRRKGCRDLAVPSPGLPNPGLFRLWACRHICFNSSGLCTGPCGNAAFCFSLPPA